MTALHHTVCMYALDRLDLLLQYEADIYAFDNKGYTVLHHATLSEHTDLIKRFVADPYKLSVDDTGAQDSKGERPLMLACKIGSHKAVIVLLELFAKRDCVDFSSKTALHYAAQYQGTVEIVNSLINSRDIDVNAIDSEKNTPLMVAIKSGKSTDFITALANDGRINYQLLDADGESILHQAIRKKRLDVVMYLCRRFPGLINLRSEKGRTPLHICIDADVDSPIFAFLLECGADRFARDNNDSVVFYEALTAERSKYITTFESLEKGYLVKHITDPNFENRYTVSLSLVKSHMLKRAKDTLNNRDLDQFGLSALHYAAMSGDLGFIKDNAFSEFGMRPSLLSKHKKKASTFAQMFGHTDIVTYLSYLQDIEEKMNAIAIDDDDSIATASAVYPELTYDFQDKSGQLTCFVKTRSSGAIKQTALFKDQESLYPVKSKKQNKATHVMLFEGEVPFNDSAKLVDLRKNKEWVDYRANLKKALTQAYKACGIEIVFDDFDFHDIADLSPFISYFDSHAAIKSFSLTTTQFGLAKNVTYEKEASAKSSLGYIRIHQVIKKIRPLEESFPEGGHLIITSLFVHDAVSHCCFKISDEEKVAFPSLPSGLVDKSRSKASFFRRRKRSVTQQKAIGQPDPDLVMDELYDDLPPCGNALSNDLARLYSYTDYYEVIRRTGSPIHAGEAPPRAVSDDDSDAIVPADAVFNRGLK